MTPPPLDAIAQALLAWQRRNPLAERLDASAVQGLGLVALPYLRRPADAPSQPTGWRQRLAGLRGAGGEGIPAFSERFIDGLTTTAAARFGWQHGAERLEGVDDWPQRRIGVDERLASSGGWPQERWLLSAALEGRQGRSRVLISAADPQRILGRRVIDKRRVAALALPLLLGAVVAFVALRPEPPPAPQLEVSGAVAPASAVAASAPGLQAVAAAPASSASPAAASEPMGVESAESAESAESVATAPADAALPAASGPPIDIRPRLGPLREARPRPPLGGGAVAAGAAPAASAAASASAVAAAPPPQVSEPAPAAREGAALPERVQPRAVPGEAVQALVSPGFATRAEAEAMLLRMREHVEKTTGKAPEGDVFPTEGQRYRAAVWPFASREEAQIINATLVARGWKTRAISF